MSRRAKKRLIIIGAILSLILVGAYIAHRMNYSIPKTRISLTAMYPEMKADSFHHYLNLPVDHNQPDADHFRGFYILSPSFYTDTNVTFLLTDGQMELVTVNTDISFFENILGGTAYVLIGVRGHDPTYFPEVYKQGKVDYARAIDLFNSDQQVEDIEMVRLDLIKKGLLSPGARINVFGASGAGILAQQYISKYGDHVKRAILESTGAPDLAQEAHLPYSPDFKDFNAAADSILRLLLQQKEIHKAAICNILYQLGRTEKDPRGAQLKLVNKLKEGSWLLSYRLKPSMNLSVLRYIISAPREVAARVRWYELTGNDLLRYDPQKGINLLCEISKATLADFIEYSNNSGHQPRQFRITRNFPGQVLILKGTRDVVFGDEINRKLQQSYPQAQLLFFDDGHRMQLDPVKYRKLRVNFLKGGFTSL